MKKIFTFALLLLTSTAMMADQLTPSEALQRLTGSQQSFARRAVRAKSAGKLTLAYTSTIDGMNSYYAFNNSQGGFVLVSADDCLPAVLGYVDSGEFNYSEMPENMRWFLKIYDQAVKNNSNSGAKVQAISRSAISPLLENAEIGNIQWGQGDPYNMYCPAYKDTCSYTGCVATAMAQVMAYYKWPLQGQGSYTHTCKILIGSNSDSEIYAPDDAVCTVDFSKAQYDWGNMVGDYRTMTTDSAQKKAVATLMYHCGVAAKMQYGTIGSGAKTFEAAHGLVNYFRYDKGADYITHLCYSNEEWDSVIYRELEAKRPVIFGGQNEFQQYGHEFICDGFKDGLFHINWGWYGKWNNYFYLTGTGMNPVVGIDANGETPAYDKSRDIHFGYDLEAIINVKPDEGGTYQGSKLITTGYTVQTEGTTIQIKSDIRQWYYDTMTFWTGAALISGNDTTLIANPYDDDLDTEGEYKTGFNVAMPDTIPSGTYAVVPYYSEDNVTWKPIKCYAGCYVPKIVWDKSTKKLSVSTADLFSVSTDAKITTNAQEYTIDRTGDNNIGDTISVTISDGGIKNISSYHVYLGLGFRNVKSSAGNESIIMAGSNDVLLSDNTVTTFGGNIYTGLDDGEYYVIPIFSPAVSASLSYAYAIINFFRAWAYIFPDDSKDYPRITVKNKFPTAITTVNTSSTEAASPIKFSRDGRVLIRHGESLFTTSGQKVR